MIKMQTRKSLRLGRIIIIHEGRRIWRNERFHQDSSLEGANSFLRTQFQIIINVKSVPQKLAKPSSWNNIKTDSNNKSAKFSSILCNDCRRYNSAVSSRNLYNQRPAYASNFWFIALSLLLYKMIKIFTHNCLIRNVSNGLTLISSVPLV